MDDSNSDDDEPVNNNNNPIVSLDKNNTIKKMIQYDKYDDPKAAIFEIMKMCQTSSFQACGDSSHPPEDKTTSAQLSITSHCSQLKQQHYIKELANQV